MKTNNLKNINYHEWRLDRLLVSVKNRRKDIVLISRERLR